MIKEANRLKEVQEYYFSKKLGEIAEMNKNGMEVINLGIGSPDLAPPENAINALTETARKNGVHGYQSYRGTVVLRQTIADYYLRTYRVNLNPEKEILPLIGSKEGIMHISLAFVNEGDGVLIPDPGYPTYTSVNNLTGARLLRYDLKSEREWEIDMTQIDELTRNGDVKIMWINYPHMPTGVAANPEIIQKLISLARDRNFLVVNDNPYSTILTNSRFSIFQLEGAREVCLELNSLSKSHSMAGWRLGWVCGHEDYINTVLKVKSNMDSGMFLGMQNAAVAALNNDEHWAEHVNAIYRDRRLVVWELLDHLQCEYDKSQSGLFVWAKIPSSCTNGAQLSDRVLKNSKVFITPGFIFGNNGEHYVRVSLCADTDKLKEALKRIHKESWVS